jgi:hypothetical protein
VPALLTFLLVVAATPEADRELATQAYRKHDYVKACELFSRATLAAPKDGALWSDYGLCLVKLGKKSEALEALQRAVTFGDEASRLHAYFNLGTLGGSALPESEGAEVVAGGHLSKLPAVAGCATAWWVLDRSDSSCGTDVCNDASGLFVGDRDEVVRKAEAGVGFDVTFEENSRGMRPCACSGPLDCGRRSEQVPSALRPRVEGCVRSQKVACLGKRGERGCGEVWDTCEREACDAVGRTGAVLSRGEKREVEAGARAYARCLKACDAEEARANQVRSFFERCTVVSINPCARAVGLVCTDEHGAPTASELRCAPPSVRE